VSADWPAASDARSRVIAPMATADRL